MRLTQAERSEIAVRNLLDAALRLVGEKGSAGMTLSEVGIEAGYSRGNPGRHFGTKAALLQALARHLRLIAAQAQYRFVGDATGLDYVLNMAVGYLSMDLIALRALHVMQAEAIMHDRGVSAQIRHFNRTSLERIAHHIRLGVAAGEFAPVQDPEATAVIIVGLVRGVVVQWLIDDTLPIDVIRAQVGDVVGRILGVGDHS